MLDFSPEMYTSTQIESPIFLYNLTFIIMYYVESQSLGRVIVLFRMCSF